MLLLLCVFFLSSSLQAWISDELRLRGDMVFRFKDKEPAAQYCSAMARNLHYYPGPQVLSAEYLVREFRPDLISKILECLVPDRVRVALVAKEFASLPDLLQEPV